MSRTRGPGNSVPTICWAGREALGTVHMKRNVKVQSLGLIPLFVFCLAHFLFGTDSGSEEGEGKNRLPGKLKVVTV